MCTHKEKLEREDEKKKKSKAKHDQVRLWAPAFDVNTCVCVCVYVCVRVYLAKETEQRWYKSAWQRGWKNKKQGHDDQNAVATQIWTDCSKPKKKKYIERKHGS